MKIAASESFQSQRVIGHKRDVGRGSGGSDLTDPSASCSRVPAARVQGTVGTTVYSRRIRYSVGLQQGTLSTNNLSVYSLFGTSCSVISVC